jgi:hypothetical protein
MVEPTVRNAVDVPLEIRTGDCEAHLSGPVTERYDTVFIDTWERLDALLLPRVNRLRDEALRHLAPGGQVLLWGYGWMVRLFVEACRALLNVPPAERRSWLASRTPESAEAVALLAPVVEQFEGQAVEDVGKALNWCRCYIVAARDTR